MAGIAPDQLLGIMQEVGRDGRSPKSARTAVPETAAATDYPDDDERGVQPLLPPLSARMWRQSASVTGALQLGFADVLQSWEARFERITLEDSNLPEIATRRVLRPRYPFSPALVETLVAVSSLLQRERTALKVTLQILVDRPETLDLGEIVPVGGLFDAIAEGDEPFTESTRHHFENARNLYRRKLLPLIEALHGIAKPEAETRPKNDKAARALRAQDRLAKTLLLSALAREVEVLKHLTATRLPALNHGSIRTPIEGREGQEVLRRCRAWATETAGVRIRTTRPIRPSPPALGGRYREHPRRRRPVRRCYGLSRHPHPHSLRGCDRRPQHPSLGSPPPLGDDGHEASSAYARPVCSCLPMPNPDPPHVVVDDLSRSVASRDR